MKTKEIIHPCTPTIEWLEAVKQELLWNNDRDVEEQKKFEAVTIQIERIGQIQNAKD